MDPEEVAPLAEAMDLKYEITCVARSGRPASVPPPAAHSVGGRSLPSSCRASQGRSGQGYGGRARTRLRRHRENEKRQATQRAKRRQGSGGNGHHARPRPDGSDSLHGGYDRTSTAIRALQRAGQQPRGGIARRRIGQGRFGRSCNGRMRWKRRTMAMRTSGYETHDQQTTREADRARAMRSCCS